MAGFISRDGNRRTGGQILADQLRVMGTDMVFCVPGESYLGLLDGLYDHRDAIKVISARLESGAANMAEAYAKLTGKVGVVAVTRGPGATNASNGVHTAFQDSTPLVVLIGQVGRAMRDREAFQEIDFRRMFGEMTKWVAQIDDARRIPEYLSRAFHTAQSGRPGPVVLALPEDMLSEQADAQDARPAMRVAAAPSPQAMETFAAMLADAARPMMILGGPGWSDQAYADARAFAEQTGLPVATDFRRQDRFDNRHASYAGQVGIGINPELLGRVKDADLLIVAGSRLGEISSQGYTLLSIPNPRQKLVHVYPGAEELGRVYRADLAINAAMPEFFAQARAIRTPAMVARWREWREGAHGDYLAFIRPTQVPGGVNLGHVVAHLNDVLPDDAIVCNGAGNYTVWLHRFFQHRGLGTQLAPTSGSMGYGVPAAIAAKLARPERQVLAFAGDGCFMMAVQELATAAQYDARVIFVVVNNSMFGTIRMHQERNFPGRVIATDLVNPDFVALARSFGLDGERVRQSGEFPDALARAQKAGTAYLIELVTDPEALTPGQTLSQARVQGLSRP